jgi:hypothetical protein
MPLQSHRRGKSRDAAAALFDQSKLNEDLVSKPCAYGTSEHFHHSSSIDMRPQAAKHVPTIDTQLEEIKENRTPKLKPPVLRSHTPLCPT